jgi:hypothetical protein
MMVQEEVWRILCLWGDQGLQSRDRFCSLHGRGRGKLHLTYSETVRSQRLSDVPGYIRKTHANWPDTKNRAIVHE